MNGLETSDLLALWERGTARHALDRSALLYACARPELPVDTIVDLPLGEITSSLLRLRSAWFGPQIRAHVDCERCGERLELNVAVSDLLHAASAPIGDEIDAGGICCRPPCLRDLAAIANERDAARAAHQLLARCMLDARDDATALSGIALREVEDALEAADPNADLAFDVHCEHCGHIGTAQLDPGELLWDEIDARARALLGDVHRLARAYGWSEREILALSPTRRASYLSMVGT